SAAVNEPDPGPLSWPAPRNAARVFISGHSLTDVPMPGDLAAIANSLATPAWVNHQLVVGSTLKARTRGVGEGNAPWSGYRQGVNREGQGMDVLAELRAPKTVPGGPYNVLLVTERHDLGGVVVWEDSVRALRHVHEQALAANPKAQTYLFEPWSDIRDKADPADWLRYERRASPMWRCLATRVNVSLAAEGRADRLHTVPAGAALAELIERAVSPPGLPGLLPPSSGEVVSQLVRDKVHLTRLGSYYMALVNYATIYRRPTQGAWAPAEVSAEQARSLQTVADAFVTAHQTLTTGAPSDLAACRAEWPAFCDAFWDQWAQREEPGLRNTWKTYRHARQCKAELDPARAGNPFVFNASADRDWWWPAPSAP
ncbi:MAG: hypothetical protein V4739_18580, partial [Pseudomonadota bacterium]